MKIGLLNKLTMNVGRSIKLIAKIIYYIQLVMSVGFLIFTLICFGEGCNTGDENELIKALIGIIAFVLVAISSALSVILLYGFGELIENSKNICQNSNSIKEHMKNIEDIDMIVNKLMTLTKEEKDLLKNESEQTERKTKSVKMIEESGKELLKEDIMQFVFDRFS